MSGFESKSLSITLTPEFDESENAVAISFAMVVERPQKEANESLVYLTLRKRTVPTQRYDGEALRATDDEGLLPLKIKDEGNTRFWHVERATQGDVLLQFRATPRVVDKNTPVGSRIDLRAESGGLQGNTISMIPVPPDADEKNRQIYTITLDWDLSTAPQNTRAVWSFGEGPAPKQRIGPSMELASSWIMVGKIKSIPPASISSTTNGSYGFYYFGEPPQAITDAAIQNAQLFPKMAEFFQDPPSAESPYRIFVRRVPRGFGGSAFTRSYVLEYDETINDVTQDELSGLLCHEMVHNWPLMEYEFQKSGFVDHNMWYNEGIAEYYGCILPLRFNLLPKSTILTHLNGHLLSYYCNPLINISNLAAQNASATGPNYNMTLPYKRGFIYFLILNTRILSASNQTRNLDTLTLRLLQKRRDRAYYGLEVWLEMLRDELGEEAIREHEAMTEGKTLSPPEDCLPGFSIVRDDKEPLELGFEEESLSGSRRVVKGLKRGSRADLAGVREGDEILKYTWLSQLTVDYEKMMRIVVKRGEEEVELVYWPRVTEKVECWQFVEDS